MKRQRLSVARCRIAAILLLPWLVAACGFAAIHQVDYDTRSVETPRMDAGSEDG